MEKEKNKISNEVSNISQETLDAIKEKHIKPKPKWEFVLKEYLIWLFAGLSFLVGALAVAVIIHMVRSNDWDLYDRVSDNLLSFILATLPYAWLLLLAIFIALVYYNFKHTKNGYRFSFRLLVVSSFLASIFMGIFFYNIGLGWTIDRAFSAQLPFYERMMFHRRMIWDNPARGFLAGKIISDLGGGNFRLRDLDNKTWLIHEPNSSSSPRKLFKEREMIKIIGETMDNSNFRAKQIRPWPGCDYANPGDCQMMFRP